MKDFIEPVFSVIHATYYETVVVEDGDRMPLVHTMRKGGLFVVVKDLNVFYNVEGNIHKISSHYLDDFHKYLIINQPKKSIVLLDIKRIC